MASGKRQMKSTQTGRRDAREFCNAELPAPTSSVTASALHAVGGYHLLHGERG